MSAQCVNVRHPVDHRCSVGGLHRPWLLLGLLLGLLDPPRRVTIGRGVCPEFLGRVVPRRWVLTSWPWISIQTCPSSTLTWTGWPHHRCRPSRWSPRNRSTHRYRPSGSPSDPSSRPGSTRAGPWQPCVDDAAWPTRGPGWRGVARRPWPACVVAGRTRPARHGGTAASSLHVPRPVLYDRLARAERLLGVSLDDPEIRVSLTSRGWPGSRARLPGPSLATWTKRLPIRGATQPCSCDVSIPSQFGKKHIPS